MDTRISAYTAANSIPVKIFKNVQLVESLINGMIPPMHAQLIPTNRCNLSCKFCSCRKRDKTDELTFEDIEKLVNDLKYLGCRSVTITGGGEPLMHEEINDIIRLFKYHNIKVGLVTNGILLDDLNELALNCITWCRISCADDRKLTPKVNDTIRYAVKRGPKVDWAFSYVVGTNPYITNLEDYITLANELEFTHVRVVSDLCDLDNVPTMGEIRKQVMVPDKIVIYQGRKEFDPGQLNCWISLLKPTIAADGYVYPCCGAQYAHEVEDLDMAPSMRMFHVKDIIKAYHGQKRFDGSQCYRCYYKNYNDILDVMIQHVDHVEFI